MKTTVVLIAFLALTILVPSWIDAQTTTTPFHDAERARQTKRVIPMRVYKGADGRLHCAIADAGIERIMFGLAAERAQFTTALHQQAMQNAGRTGWLESGSRVHVPGYTEHEGPHAPIALSLPLGDEFLWFSDQGIRFQVSVSRDPMLVLVDRAKPLSAITLEPNIGIDNPFVDSFPKTSVDGRVRSGSTRLDADAVAQQYWVYELKDLDTGDTFDPDFFTVHGFSVPRPGIGQVIESGPVRGDADVIAQAHYVYALKDLDTGNVADPDFYIIP